ncbi:hypothetical protein Tco_1290565 [Tanacetum coccineum]
MSLPSSSYGFWLERWLRRSRIWFNINLISFWRSYTRLFSALDNMTMNDLRLGKRRPSHPTREVTRGKNGCLMCIYMEFILDEPAEIMEDGGLELLVVKIFKEVMTVACYQITITWKIISEDMVRARVVSRVVFMRLFWMGEDSFDEMSMTSVLVIFLRGLLVEELALKAIE